jgi:hypothetical protein
VATPADVSAQAGVRKCRRGRGWWDTDVRSHQSLPAGPLTAAGLVLGISGFAALLPATWACSVRWSLVFAGVSACGVLVTMWHMHFAPDR